jgi:hypothetical protein
MGMFSFYSVRKPRQYDHKPIYWNPHKEALDKRIHDVKREMGLEIPDEEYKPNIKGTFVQGTSHLKKSQDKGDDVRGRTYKNMKLLLAAAILGGLLWYLFM